MAKDSYKDILGFTWKKENGKYVQYRGDGSRTGKIKDAKPTVTTNKNKNKNIRGQHLKYKKNKETRKQDPNNPVAGDTKKTKRRRVQGGYTGGDTLVYTGTKWVPKAEYKKITPDRVGKIDKNSKEYKHAKQINESIKINQKPKNLKGVGPVKDGAKYGKNLKNTTQGIGPVKDGKTYGKNLKKKPEVKKPEVKEQKLSINKNNKEEVGDKKEKLKIKKSSAKNFIKTKKGFARRGTPMAKRAEERERRRKALAAKGYMKNK